MTRRVGRKKSGGTEDSSSDKDNEDVNTDRGR